MQNISEQLQTQQENGVNRNKTRKSSNFFFQILKSKRRSSKQFVEMKLPDANEAAESISGITTKEEGKELNLNTSKSRIPVLKSKIQNKAEAQVQTEGLSAESDLYLTDGSQSVSECYVFIY